MTRTWTILLAAAALAVAIPATRAADNELTAKEKADGVKLLFNGKDATGWHRTSAGLGGWEVKDGTLTLNGKGGMIYVDGKYDNFVLSCEFKMSKGCNSGIFVRVGDEKNEVQTGLEVQVQDDFGKQPNRNSAGSIYDLVAPTKNTVKPAGEWNACVITCDKNKITVELNGEKVTEINVDEWTKPGERPDGSNHKYKLAIKDFPREGSIGFQDHGKEVSFRNIKIKPLPAK